MFWGDTMHDFYLYAIDSNGKISNIDNSLENLRRILQSGYILNRRTLGMTGGGFNGTDYISLSDYDKRFENIYKDDDVFRDYTAYTMYSTKAISLMIAKDMVKVKTPKLIKPIESSPLSYFGYVLSAWDILEGLYTDLPDEVQVKGRIKEEAFRGITIPTKEIASAYSISKVKDIYLKIKEFLEKYEYYLRIYDVASIEEIKSEKDIEGIIKRSH